MTRVTSVETRFVVTYAESVARSVCGLVRTTTVLCRCDRGADEQWRRQSSEYGPVNARRASRESNEMRPLRYSINVTLDGCCHHQAGLPPGRGVDALLDR